jgi:hypothetical protein
MAKDLPIAKILIVKFWLLRPNFIDGLGAQLVTNAASLSVYIVGRGPIPSKFFVYRPKIMISSGICRNFHNSSSRFQISAKKTVEGIKKGKGGNHGRSAAQPIGIDHQPVQRE